MLIARLSCLVLLSMFLAAPAAAKDAPRWQMVPELSSIHYKNTAIQPEPIPLNAFDADIVFDPNNLDASRITLRANISIMFLPPDKVNMEIMGNLPQTTEVGEGDSTATLTMDKIRHKSGNEYDAVSMLQVGNRKHSLMVPLVITAARANNPAGIRMTIRGAMNSSRSDYADNSHALPSPNNVPVVFTIVADPVTPAAR